MAEINIERRKKSRWPWILLIIILILIVAWAIYEYGFKPDTTTMNQIIPVSVMPGSSIF